MAVEANTNLAADFGTIKSIDFVNLFSDRFDQLRELLGISRIIDLPADRELVTYKWATDLKDGKVAEGETIPLSKVTRVKDKTHTLEMQKYRRNVTAEAIARHGKATAVDRANDEILYAIAGELRANYFTLLGKSTTKVKGDNYKQAFARSIGKAKSFQAFSGHQLVTFVNSMDVYEYLGDTNTFVGADGNGVFGFELLTGFLGQKFVIALPEVPEGTIYTTAVSNLQLARLDLQASGLKGTIIDYTDVNNIIGVAHDRKTENASLDALFLLSTVLFAEVPEGVVMATVEVPSAG